MTSIQVVCRCIVDTFFFAKRLTLLNTGNVRGERWTLTSFSQYNKYRANANQKTNMSVEEIRKPTTNSQ